jgi:hypothetical protein
MDPLKHELDRTTREHSTPPPCTVSDGYLAWWVQATPAISPLLVCIISSHNGIAEVLRLTGACGQYCKILDPRANNEWSLIDIGGALHRDSILNARHLPGLILNISIIIMVFSRPINRAEKSKGKTYFSRTMKPLLDFYRSLSITKH